MGSELIVIAICTFGGSCDRAASAYYEQSIQLQTSAKNVQKIAENEIGKEELSYIGIIAGISFVHQGTLPIGKHVNIQIGDQNILQLHFNLN